jgi:LysM repeat protein
LITPTALPGIGSDTSAGGECTYTIQRGDTLFRIATHNNTTVSEIADANPGININLIQPGQVITLPGCTSSGSGEVTVPTTAPEPSGNVPAGSGTTYTVQPGDTLFAIAQRFGVTVQAIVNANNLSNPNNLSLGQELIIPAAS